MVATRILGAHVIDPVSGRNEIADIYLQHNKIAAIGQAPAGFEAQQTIDAQGLTAAPGLVDLASPATAAKAALPARPWPPPLAASPACAARRKRDRCWIPRQ